jgi:predicted phosphodiesterase
MADAPYSDEERDTIMPDVIDSLPSDAEMLFHLGDFEYKKKDQCGEWAYEVASSILKRSRVPVFVVPGDNDLNGKL